MRIGLVLIGITIAAGVGYKVHAIGQHSSQPVAVTIPSSEAPPSAADPMPPAIAAPEPAFVRVPDLAHKAADVAEYLLSTQGLGHTLIGPNVDDFDPNQLRVCSTLPHAGTRVRSGTRVGLVVRWMGCSGL